MNNQLTGASKEGHLSIGADTAEPERVAPVVYPDSVAYLAMDGAAAPKGVTFGGGTKSDSFNGSAFDDVITTGGGLSNYVMAFSGDDMVVGGDGKDFIRIKASFVRTSVRRHKGCAAMLWAAQP